MAALIFKLRNVPEDEAEAIRALMHEHAIDWYETSAGNWGIAMPAIWVANDDHTERAKSLIEQYQSERTTAQRKLYEEREQAGQNTTFLQRVMAHPFRIAGIFVFCVFILYVSIHPFMQMIEFSRQ